MNETIQAKDGLRAENGPLAHALETLSRIGARSGEQMQHGLIEASVALTQAAGSLLEEAKAQTSKVASNANRELKEHPIATTASIVLAGAALLTLMISLRETAAKAAAPAGSGSESDRADKADKPDASERPASRKKRHKDH